MLWPDATRVAAEEMLDQRSATSLHRKNPAAYASSCAFAPAGEMVISDQQQNAVSLVFADFIYFGETLPPRAQSYFLKFDLFD